MKGLKSALQAAASAAAAATSAAAAATTAAVEAASGPRALREYVLLHPDRPEARAGLGGTWSVHLARPKRQGSAAALPLVSVWLLDKRALLAASADSPEEAEAALAAARAGAAALSRVRHPSLVRVIEPLEETRHVLALVTEGVWGTASELLTDYSDSSSSSSSPPSSSSARAKEARSVSRLEVLHGLANVSRALAFLHRDSAAVPSSSSSSSGSSAIVHRAVGPSAVVLTRSGGWKLAGMELSVPESDPACQRAGGSFFDFGGGGGFGGGGFGGNGASSSPSALPFEVAAASRPELAYASPELVEASSPLTTATDIFSFGALAASLLSARRAPLFFSPSSSSSGGGNSSSSSSPAAHLAAVRALASSPGGLQATGLRNGGCDPAAAASLAPLLSPDASARPRAAEVERLPLFAADEGLRALRALEAMSSLPSSSSSVALFAAADELGSTAAGEAPGGGGKLGVLYRVRALLPSFDARVRQLLVLPPLLLEARAAARAGGAGAAAGDGETLAVCLSIILDIARTQGKAEFEASTLPALRAVCANMFSAPSPKRKQQVAAAPPTAAASEGASATTLPLPPPPPPPSHPTVTATPAALVLLERAPFLAQRCPPDLLLPLVCRALDTSDGIALSSADASAAAAVARAQELAAAASPAVGASAGPQASEAQLLPRLHRLALATTAARVRAACFRALGELCAGSVSNVESGEDGLSPSSSSTFYQGRAPEPLPREAAVAALASFARAAAVDGSASTADAGISLAASLAARWGGRQLAAAHVIPALAPLLAHGDDVLPDDALGRVAEAIRGHVAAIEAERAARRGRKGAGVGGGGGGGGGMRTAAAAPLPTAFGATATTKQQPQAPAAAAAPRAQATLHPLFAPSAPVTTKMAPAAAAAPPLPALPVLLPPPPPPPPASSVAVSKRHQFFPPPQPAAAPAAGTVALSADRVPSLGLSSDLFGDWSVAAETTGGSGGEKAPAVGTPHAAADNGGGGSADDAAFDALFAAAAVSAKQRQEQQQQQHQRQKQEVGGSARGAPMRPRPAAPPPPRPNDGGSGSSSLI